jgi:hypothetical protein
MDVADEYYAERSGNRRIRELPAKWRGALLPQREILPRRRLFLRPHGQIREPLPFFRHSKPKCLIVFIRLKQCELTTLFGSTL